MEWIFEEIRDFGFTAIACGAMAWYVKYITDKFMSLLKQEQDRHEAESDKLTEALNNNTVALTKLAERIGVQDE